MKEQEQATGMIVTRSEEERIKVEERSIEVIPAWRFLLEMAEL